MEYMKCWKLGTECDFGAGILTTCTHFFIQKIPHFMPVCLIDYESLKWWQGYSASRSCLSLLWQPWDVIYIENMLSNDTKCEYFMFCVHHLITSTESLCLPPPLSQCGEILTARGTTGTHFVTDSVTFSCCCIPTMKSNGCPRVHCWYMGTWGTAFVCLIFLSVFRSNDLPVKFDSTRGSLWKEFLCLLLLWQNGMQNLLFATCLFLACYN